MAETKVSSKLGGDKITTDATGRFRIGDIVLSRFQLAQEKLIMAVDEHDQRKLASAILSVIGLMQPLLPVMNLDGIKEQKEYKDGIQKEIDSLLRDFQDLYNKEADDNTISTVVIKIQYLIGESTKQFDKVGIDYSKNITGDTGGYNLDD